MKFYYSSSQFHSNRSQPINYQSWKEQSNTIIVAKNVKNTIPTNVDVCRPFPSTEYCLNKTNNFKANPIKHYRKQYVNLNSDNTGFSKQSLINSLDKPGSNIVTSVDRNICNETSDINQLMYTHILKNKDIAPSTSDKFYDQSLNKIICVACNPSALVLKPATTILDNKYSSSNKEYLYKKCKTFNQNLPADYISNNHDCYNKCVYYNNKYKPDTNEYRNKKYSTNGPVSGSTRIATLKYSSSVLCCNYKTSNINCIHDTKTKTYDPILKKEVCPSCCNVKISSKKSKINLLK
jgi:hypothetical protein